MPLNINQIATVIREQITKYGTTTKVADRGVVVMVGDGVVMAQGISEVMLGEVVLIGKKSAPGLVLVLEEATCGIVLLTNDYHIKQNDIVVRTKKLATAPVGESLLGRVIDPQGKVLDGGADLQKTKDRLIERIAPGVITRKSVSRPLQTGIFAIDSLVPIGLGQRELIIGDRQLGKTALAIDTIINQKGKNVRCIYVAIGQKASIVATIIEKLKLNKSLEYTTVVVTTASDPATMQYLAPYTGITIAEE